MKKRKILIVDDEEHILLLLRDNLMYEGFEVCEARDGEEALEMADKCSPDLIVLDIGLPKLDGWHVCQRLNINEKTKDVPVVILSARAQDGDIIRGREYGAKAYLKKPCHPRELVNAVKSNLRADISE